MKLGHEDGARGKHNRSVQCGEGALLALDCIVEPNGCMWHTVGEVCGNVLVFGWNQHHVVCGAGHGVHGPDERGDDDGKAERHAVCVCPKQRKPID